MLSQQAFGKTAIPMLLQNSLLPVYYNEMFGQMKTLIDCFEKASFKDHVFCGGVNDPGDIKGNAKLREAYEMGKAVGGHLAL